MTTTTGNHAQSTGTRPAFTTLGRIVADRVSRPVPTDRIARQQLIENHLASALYLARTADSPQGLQRATGRAIRAASLLKFHCAELAGGAL